MTDTEPTAYTSKTDPGEQAPVQTKSQRFATVKIDFFTDGSHVVSSKGGERLADGRFEQALTDVYIHLGEQRLAAANKGDYGA